MTETVIPFPLRVPKWRVIYAIILREMRVRFADRYLGYLWALFEPLIHISVYMIIYFALGRQSPVEEPMPVFFATGILPWLLFNGTAMRVSQAVNANKALLVYPHLFPIDFMLGRTLLEGAAMFAVTVILSLVAYYIYGFTVEHPLSALGALFVTGMMGAGFGMVNSALFDLFPSYENLVKSVMRLIYFTSGAFFLAGDLPPALQEALYWNPQLHNVDWFRSAVLHSYDGTFYKPPALLTLALALFLLGLMVERIRRREMRTP